MPNLTDNIEAKLASPSYIYMYLKKQNIILGVNSTLQNPATGF